MTAKLEFEVISGLYCDFLNYLVENGIYIADVISTDFGFKAVCYAKDYKKIALCARKYQCRIKIKKRMGIYFKIRKHLKRKGVFVGAALVFVYIFVFSQLIWRIDVISPSKNITEDVYSLLYANNCYCGAVFSQEKNQQLIQKIFMEVDNVGYVTMNFYKGILTCKVDATINKLPYLENRTDGNITSSADGIIEQLEVYNGFSNIKIGQTVLKGDLLVSATYIDRNGTLQQVMPRAYIKAYCVKEYSAKVMYNKSTSLRTGEYTDRVTLHILDKDITLKKEDTSDYEMYDAEKKYECVEFMGFRMPATKETVRFYKKENTEIINDENTAYAAAVKAVNAVVAGDASLIETDSAEYYSKKEEDGITVFCRVYGHYDITK